MASPIAFSLPQNFDLQNVVGRLGRSFQLKGYAVRSYPVGAGACLEVSRNTGGLNTVIGRCEGIKINFMPGANLLNVSFSDEQWTDKIIGFVVGWFTCWIPWIFTAIGAYNQYRLPKTVENELQIILGTVSTPTGGYYQSPAAPAQPPAYQAYQTYQTPQQHTPPAQPGGYYPPQGPAPATPTVPQQAPMPRPEPPQPPRAPAPSVPVQGPAPAPGAPVPPEEPPFTPPDPFHVQVKTPENPFACEEPPHVENPFKDGNPFDMSSPFGQVKPNSPPASSIPSTPAPAAVPPVGEKGKKVCPSCGKTLDAESVFCMYCGARQDS